MTTPPSISTLLNHDDVLHSLGLKVKPSLNGFRCKVCDGHVHRVNSHSDGAWYYCARCGFSGDSIELYAWRRHLPIAAAIDILTEQYMFNPDAKARLHYTEVIIPERQSRRCFMETAKRLLEQSDSHARHLLQQYGLYSGFPIRASAFLGYATGPMLLEMFGVMKKKSGMLVFPLQELPGKITGFYCMGQGEYQEYKHLRSKGYAQQPAGAAFLDQLPSTATPIYAIDNLYAALYLKELLHLQLGWAHPCPVIGVDFSQPTRFSRDVDSTVIIRTLRSPYEILPTVVESGLRQVRITGQPVLLDDDPVQCTQERINVLGALKFLQEMCYTAYTPPVLKQSTLPVTDAPAVPNYNTIQYDGMTLEDHPDGIYRLTACKKPRKVSELKIVPETVINCLPSNRSYVIGTICVRDKVLKFASWLADIQKAPLRWVHKHLTAAGVADVAVSQRWGPKLYDIGVLFSKPTYCTTHEFVQWDPTINAWTGPDFCITTESITINDVPNVGFSMYAVIKAVYDRDKLRDELNHIPDTVLRYFWDVFAAIVYSILAPVNRLPRINVGFRGSADCTGVMDWLINSLRIPTVPFDYNGSIKTIKAVVMHHTLPVLIPITTEPRFDAAVKLLVKRATVRNVMVDVSAYNMSTACAGWYVIEIPSGDACVTADMADALLTDFLHWTAKQGISLSNSVPPLQAVKDRLAVWSTDRLGRNLLG